MNRYKASIIIAFYNNLRFLRLVLAGFLRQSEKNFEMIIADDGSGEEVVSELEKLSHSYALPLRHIWHEDAGWRKNKILNSSILRSHSDYIIIIDGDCIPHRHFVKEHLRNQEKNKILSGRRVNLSEQITGRLTEQMVINGFLEKNILRWLKEGLYGKTTHAEKGLYLPCLRRYLNRKNKGLLGCNFSMHKEDLYLINGFDERYEAPTVGEDTDIELRAGMVGLGIKSVRNLAIQYHLYHRKLSRANQNRLILENTRESGLFRTPYGLIRD